MNDEPRHWKCLEATGPWPFITRRVFRHENRSEHIWISRAHRKRLAAPVVPEPDARTQTGTSPKLNGWIAGLFLLGSLLFAFGCVFSLVPEWAQRMSLRSTQINALYFAGSIPFTTAAYLQLFQAANAPFGSQPGVRGPARPNWFGWRPREIGWLSCALLALPPKP